jgi:UDP-N-acetylmuramoyl-tripeptide--D-alanyl-D-alanine ligase
MGLGYRQILKSITHSIGNKAYRKKLNKKPSMFSTLKELCEKVGIETENLDEQVKAKLNTTVSYVCRYGDRFTENCICVQLNDDTDDIMKKAMSEGALVCLTDHKIDGVPCIVVENTAVIYADMCSIYRDKATIKTTVVVGSIGKTTAKKMVEVVYSKGFDTLCDSGNDNILDSIGSISQHIPDKAEQYIAEISEDTPGLIEQMSKIVKPDVAIITTIDKSHIEFYGSEENIFNEFRSVTKYMREDGVCIICIDDSNAKNLIKDKKVVFVSAKGNDADFMATDIKVTNAGLQFNVYEKATGKSYPVKLINSFALHNVTSALYAFAAGVVAGVTYDKIVEGLASYRATGIRQNIYKSGSNVVYADCYNAVAKSVRSAVNASCDIPIKGKRIAVLGDVAEAGDYTESTHLEIVDIVNNSTFDVLLTYGTELQKAISNSKMRENLTVLTFDNQKDMNKAIKQQIKKGDLVLFKASHSGKLKDSIAATFPLAYLYQSIKYYTPRIKWHFKVIMN